MDRKETRPSDSSLFVSMELLLALLQRSGIAPEFGTSGDGCNGLFVTVKRYSAGLGPRLRARC